MGGGPPRPHEMTSYAYDNSGLGSSGNGAKRYSRPRTTRMRMPPPFHLTPLNLVTVL